MRRIPQPKLGAYAGLAALGLMAALAFSRPELTALAAAFALALIAGLALARPPGVELTTSIDRLRALEGEEVGVLLTLEADTAIERLEIHVRLPEGLELVERASPFAVRLPSRTRTIELPVRCARWGGYPLAEVYLRARDPVGFFTFERHIEPETTLRVYPRPEALRDIVAPLATQPFVGNQVSRTRGEGIEFADLRDFVPGDRVRRINWRASARRGALYVNEYHPERNTDVVVFVDSFVDVRRGARGTLDLAVGAASTLVAAYLARRDRVGLVAFGGILQWILPESGLKQRYRIADALIGTEVTLSYAWKDVDVIPRRTLPAQALVLALSPLLDERAVGALLDLRARGFDVAVLEVSPLPFAPAGGGSADQLAHRVWRMRREELRSRYLERGVPVVEWRAGEPLMAATEEVGRFRRRSRSVRA